MDSRKLKASLLAALACTALVSCDDDDSNDNQPAAEQSTGNQPLTEPQAVAVIRAANNGEVAHAQLALQNATDPEVRAFAQRMLDEHSQAQAQLDALVSSLGITPEEGPVSQQLTADAQALAAELQGLIALDTDTTTSGGTPTGGTAGTGGTDGTGGTGGSDGTGGTGGPTGGTPYPQTQGVTHFDWGYMQAQALVHQRVLNLIDTQIAPALTTPELVTYGANTRTAVTMHLNDACTLTARLSADLNAAGGATGTPFTQLQFGDWRGACGVAPAQ